MSEVITVGSPAPELLATAENMLAVAQSYKIDCVEMREAAGADLQQVKRLSKNLEDERKAITGPLDLAKKRVMDLFRKPTEYLERAELTIKRACIAWDGEQDRQRREREAEAARKADEERKRLRDEAAAQQKAGNVETAHAISQAAEMVAPVPVDCGPARMPGESLRDQWSAEVDDLVELARAVGAGEISPENIQPNLPVLNKQAVALKGSLAIPGVRAVCRKILAARAA